MSDSFIDEDLNYDVKINIKKFSNPKSPIVKKAFREGLDRFFNSIEEMCQFMTEVGANHPKGVNFRYLIHLMSYYSTSKALSNLEEKGMIMSSVNEDGEVVYSLTPLGKHVTDDLL